MGELYFGVPTWAWFIIFMQFITGYWIDRNAKQAHMRYLFIMRQVGADVAIPGEPDSNR